ncbi:MAG: hypothetical protein GXY67_03855 [Clostridiales bacterium]|nr:hypothetical protein [Clostridiales bacterium]
MKALLSWAKPIVRPLRNLYYRLYPHLRFLFTHQKHILLYVNNNAMTSHIQRFVQTVMGDPCYRFFLCDPGFPRENDPKNEFQQFILKYSIPLCPHPGRRAFDLIVCADLRTPASFTKKMTPILYVNHGLHIISMDGGQNLYCYGDYAKGEDGKPKFSRMLESNALIMEAMKESDPDMAALMVHTGFKFAAETEAALKRRMETRRLLGVSQDTCLVGFFGSWRENSLFHTLGEGIFDACDLLRNRGYQFLFSIHPNEYTSYDPSIRPMGELVEAQRQRGMLVRSPKEDFLPYLAACDIVISDFSSLAESAILAGRKLIFSRYPDGLVWKHSLTAQARQILPTLEKPEGLASLLESVAKEPIHPFILQARKQLVREDHDDIVKTVTRELLRLPPHHSAPEKEARP